MHGHPNPDCCCLCLVRNSRLNTLQQLVKGEPCALLKSFIVGVLHVEKLGGEHQFVEPRITSTEGEIGETAPLQRRLRAHFQRRFSNLDLELCETFCGKSREKRLARGEMPIGCRLGYSQVLGESIERHRLRRSTFQCRPRSAQQRGTKVTMVVGKGPFALSSGTQVCSARLIHQCSLYRPNSDGPLR